MLTLALLFLFGVLGIAETLENEDHPPGGTTTVHITGSNAFSLPANNITDDERRRFVIGNSFFKRNWVAAPGSTSARDGLGPMFIGRSCAACHTGDGRGAPPDFHNGIADQPVALLLRMSVPAKNGAGVQPEPTYGDQFQNAAIPGVLPEGKVTLRYTPISGKFADGQNYELLQPEYGFSDLQYGPMVGGLMISPRIAQQLIGVGLLEAIAEQDILANGQRQAQAAGPIKGLPNYVFDSYVGKKMLGRFGWKANSPTLAHQTAAAFVNDIGITSHVFPQEICGTPQTSCRAVAKASRDVDIDDKTFRDVVFYQQVLAPPARRQANDVEVKMGRRLFSAAACAQCHQPDYVTKSSPFVEFASNSLSGQHIWPYTDLLLHDMGEALADNRPDGEANGRQWRTPPLWGIGLIPAVNNHQRLLHDGRARGVLEAILWHGGEAEQSRDQVLKMTEQERRALVKFVESL